MFDDQQNSAAVPPPNLPMEPEDMFAGVEKGEQALSDPKMPDALSSGMLKRKGSEVMPTVQSGSDSEVPVAVISSTAQPVLGKIFLVILIIVAVGGLGFGGWWLYNRFVEVPADVTTPTPETSVPPITETTPAATIPVPVPDQLLVSPAATSTITTEIKNDAILFGAPVDGDKDGLSDLREQEVGTDPNKSDTDLDGLIDGDEVFIWKTNPLNPDTDGDSYPDGDEIKNGYNPLGRGRLLNSSTSTVPTAPTSTK